MNLEVGDSLKLEDDAGNERIVKVERVSPDVRVNINPGLPRDKDVRRLDADEWSIEVV